MLVIINRDKNLFLLMKFLFTKLDIILKLDGKDKMHFFCLN